VLSQPKRFALLAYLAVESNLTPVDREALKFLFWPDKASGNASTNLRKALFFLRQHLGADTIVSVGTRLAVAQQHLQCDVLRGRHTWTTETMDLSGIEFLDGFHFRSASQGWDRWVDRVRDAVNGGRERDLSPLASASFSPSRLRIIVLPFSSPPEHEAMALGFGLEVADRLRTQGFPVLSPSVHPDEAPTDLSVSHPTKGDMALRGVVEVTEEGLAVSVVVSDTHSQTQVWGDRYTASGSAMPLAEQVALALVSRLRGSPRRSGRPEAASTDIQAYMDYLRGRASEWGPTSSILGAIGHYEAATRRDPGFAEAYARTAHALVVLRLTSVSADAGSLDRAERAAMKALEHDPFEPLAHAARADLHMIKWQWDDARTHYEAAVRFGPTYPRPRAMYSAFLLGQGEFERAVDQATLLTQLDPGSPDTWVSLGFALFYRGEFQRALEAHDQALALAPSHPWALMEIAWNLSMLEEHHAAAEQARIALRVVDSRDHWALATMGWVLGRAGALDEANRLFRILTTVAESFEVDALSMAVIHLAVDDLEAAIAWTQRISRGAPQGCWILPASRQFLRPIADDRRVQATISRILGGQTDRTSTRST